MAEDPVEKPDRTKQIRESAQGRSFAGWRSSVGDAPKGAGPAAREARQRRLRRDHEQARKESGAVQQGRRMGGATSPAARDQARAERVAENRARREAKRQEQLEAAVRKQFEEAFPGLEQVFMDRQGVQAAVAQAMPGDLQSLFAGPGPGQDAVIANVGGALVWRPVSALVASAGFPWDKVAFGFRILTGADAGKVRIYGGTIREHFGNGVSHPVDEKVVTISGLQTVSAEWNLATNDTDVVAGKDNTDDTDEVLYRPLYTFDLVEGTASLVKIHLWDWDSLPKQAP
jgi:hypothetical protein